MAKQHPKKPQKNKTEVIRINRKKDWERVIQSVDKREVPVDVLEKVRVSLVDGSQITVDVKSLTKEGLSNTEIEKLLNKKFFEMDDIIENVDFFVDVDSVSERVLPETLKLLKDL